MKNALDWIKANPFNVACAAIAFVALTAFVYVLLMAAPSFVAKKSDEVKQLQTRQRALMNIPVPLPNEDPNAEPYIERVVINQRVIEDVDKIYSSIKSQYEQIKLETSDKNAARHRTVMLGGGELWPDSTRNDLFEGALKSYRDHFKAAFDYNNPNSWNMPALQAGSPPSDAQIKQALDTTALNFVRSIGVESAGALTEEQASQLYAEQRMQLMQLLADRARSIHIYASLPADEDPFAAEAETTDQPAGPATGGGFEALLGGGAVRGGGAVAGQTGLPTEYPFVIAPWAFADTAPKPDQLWEGQVELWILRDVMFAIHQTNKVGQNIDVIAPDGTLRSEPATVLNSPIKRLIRLEHIPGFVGLHTLGAVTTSKGSNTESGFGFAQPDLGRVAGLGTPGAGTASIYPTPPAELIPKEPTVAAAEHFGITPTGRVSNSVFDVRHSRLVIDIEWQALPLLMQQLRDTNFMTVIQADVEDIDEYDMLLKGYVYGRGDVVRAELLIESLWFREWTSNYMPKIVREKLLIEPPANAAGAAAENQPF